MQSAYLLDTSIIHYNETKILYPVFKSVVNSVIDFSNIVLASSSTAALSRLESIQKKFTSKLEGMSELTYDERLKELRLSSIQRRKDRGILYFAQRLARTEPELSGFPKLKKHRFEKINFYVSGHSYSSKNWSIKNSFVNRLYCSSAPFVGSRLFNSLPHLVKSTSSENMNTNSDQLKQQTDNFLNHINYRPTGSKKSNSLLYILRSWT